MNFYNIPTVTWKVSGSELMLPNSKQEWNVQEVNLPKLVTGIKLKFDFKDHDF